MEEMSPDLRRMSCYGPCYDHTVLVAAPSTVWSPSGGGAVAIL